MTVISRLACAALLVVAAFALLFGCKAQQRIGSLDLEETFSNPNLRKLAWAAANGNGAQIDRLVSGGVDVNGEGTKGITPLWWAIWAQSPSGVVELLGKGAKANVQPAGLPSSMEIAARVTGPQILEALLEHGGDPNLQSKSSFGYTPLHGANIGKNISSTKLLIESKADLNIRDSAGWTPFLHACILFNFEQAILLLNAGADYTATINGYDGPITVWTALDRAEKRLRGGSDADLSRRQLLELLRAKVRDGRAEGAGR